ncbi:MULTISPECIES: TetR/AcrR family transcriptional regulator [Streptomyces]|uniref:AcrR family transcriptional regulator n=1 Tax=Streptomyces demainii TaxID=588122 RepID=A0ABT9KLL7_9ACTN|nr:MULTISPECIES: TetR family transcriptional regulator [Streptomyces]MCO8307050.1 TetR/AcrR family transcriptional regulator [Streptomyces sp. RKCA744]MDP9609317.1 AcrR family transcriptional regulator [Streptomyces demainii]
MTTESRPGLRERKKQRTRDAISDAAIALFVERGFNEVSVARIAEAAEVSKRTLFAYFPTKEDLVVHRMADHETESARVVRARPAHTAPLDALRDHFLDGLRRRDPITGLNDMPQIRELTQLIFRTPALIDRMQRFRAGGERALTEALCDTTDAPELIARMASVQIIAVQWALSMENFERLISGETADARYPDAARSAEQAFALLANGLATVG